MIWRSGRCLALCGPGLDVRCAVRLSHDIGATQYGVMPLETADETAVGWNICGRYLCLLPWPGFRSSGLPHAKAPIVLAHVFRGVAASRAGVMFFMHLRSERRNLVLPSISTIFSCCHDEHDLVGQFPAAAFRLLKYMLGTSGIARATR